MPDIYVSRAGMENKDLDAKFTNTELGGLKDDLARLQQQTKIKDEGIAILQSTIESMQRPPLGCSTELGLLSSFPNGGSGRRRGLWGRSGDSNRPGIR